jgi:uncharacterized GH25 family protein
MRIAVVLALAWLGLPAQPAQAHYNMLLPELAFGRKDEALTLTYQWGHPFEHQLFDAPKPTSLQVRTPDGKITELATKLTRVALPGEKDSRVVGHRLSYTPDQRGDHLFVLQTPPIFLKEDGAWVQDTVKVVLHVQSEKGWDEGIGTDFEWRPLTRPYGLLPGTIFQARLLELPPGVVNPVPFSGKVVEIEHYNPTPPPELPAEEFITRTVKTDPNGVVTTNLPEAGWWCLTASREAGTREHEGKSYPLHQRTTFWVHIHTSPKR